MEPTKSNLYDLLVNAGSRLDPIAERSDGEDYRHLLRQCCHFYANLILTLELLASA